MAIVASRYLWEEADDRWMFQDDAVFWGGKGLDPCLAAKWITQHWCDDQKKLEKGARQVDWIMVNMDAEAHICFYFDISHEQRCKKTYIQEKML